MAPIEVCVGKYCHVSSPREVMLKRACARGAKGGMVGRVPKPQEDDDNVEVAHRHQLGKALCRSPFVQACSTQPRRMPRCE